MEKKLLNVVNFEMKWTDLDAYKHLNNARYSDFMVECRSKLLWEISKLDGMCEFILESLTINFKKPFYYPDEIIVEQYLTELNKASFDLNYVFKSSSSKEIVHTEGFAKMVCYDPVKKRICRVPNELLQIFNSI